MDKPYILIIDDEVLLLSSFPSLLGRDFNVFTASNGENGLLKFKSNPYISLILLDLDMPGMNGVETLKAIRAVDEKIKIVIMTGNSSHELAMQCADLAVHGYIEKPVDPECLVTRLKKVLGIVNYPVLKNYWLEEYETKAASMSPMIKNAIAFIHENANEGITRDEVSVYLGITPDHLCKKLNKECGLTIADYINRYKIHISHEYLLNMPDKTIAQVAEKVGIRDANYFSKLFKKYSGLSPGEFKKKPPNN